MQVLGWILFGLGVLVLLVCAVWLLIVAWKESPLWGIGSFFCDIVALIFVITHWDDAKRPFLGKLAGLGLIFLAGFAGGPDFGDDSDSADDSAMVQNGTDTDDEPEVAPPASPLAPTLAPARTNTVSPVISNVATQRVARPIQPRRPPPEPVAAAATDSPPKPTPPPAKRPEPESLLLPGHDTAIDVEVLSTGEPDNSGLRSLNLRMTNHARKTAKQVRMTVFYLGKRKEILKQWATSVYDPKPSLTSNATIEISQPAFGMPEFTSTIVVRVDMVRFEDGTEWQR